MAHVRVTTALVEEKSATSKSAASTSSRHSCSRSNRPAHSKLPTIQEEVNQPGARATPAADLHANLDKNCCGCDARGYFDQCHHEREEREMRHCPDYDREYSPPGNVHWIMEREERECHDVENRRRAQYEKDYGHPEGLVRNAAWQPRSEVVAVMQDNDAAQVSDSGDNMALTAFPALAPRLQSVTYPDNFKPNIQKYDDCSDPNIWLSTYYVTVKAAGSSFDHMATYFLLVMGDAPSLWLNNLPAGSITSWADLSQAFTSNFQVTYNRPSNAFNLGRVTMKPDERLWDYTNRFFENRNTCVDVRDEWVVDSYKKGLRDRKVFEKIHESGAKMVAPLMEVVNKLINTEEALVNQFDHDDKQDASTSGAAGDSSSKFRKRPSEVLTEDGRRPSTLNIEELNAVLDSPCTFHEGGTHTVRECQQFKRVFRASKDPKQPRSNGDRSSSRC
jgi:hypothetical protein